MISAARILVILGVILIVIGGMVYLAGRFNLPLGRLPGDILIERNNITCFFPIVTTILLSIVLTLVLNIIVRLLNK
jgi:hypothetical protein